MILVSTGWDALLIYVRYDGACLEIRVGVGCLALLIWLVTKIVGWCRQAEGPKLTT